MKVSVPSERNFEIYHAVCTQGMSRREAAAIYELSSTRVHQIVEQVRFYLANFGSPELMFTPPEFTELGALRISYDRLSFLYTLLMRKWQQSEMPRPTAGENGEAAAAPRTLPPLGGNLRLVQQALRVMVEQTKIAGRMTQVHAQLVSFNFLSEKEPVEEVIEAADDAELPAGPLFVTQTDLPPKGGCTVPQARVPNNAQEVFEDFVASHARAIPSDSIAAALEERIAKHEQKKRPEQKRR